MKKIKTGTLTFHAAHNYGAMLQAYALQQIIIQMGYDNEIINFVCVNPRNKHKYPTKLKQTIALLLSYLQRLPYQKQLQQKYLSFEKFILDNLKISEQCLSLKDVENLVVKYDCCIVGSDQVWNMNTSSFGWVYYLPFEGKACISYAASMGNMDLLTISNEDKEKVRDCLLRFNMIGVRDGHTKELVKEISGREAQIVIDPVFLLSSEKWLEKVDNTPLIKGKYILLYSLYYSSEISRIAMRFSKKMGIKIVLINEWTVRPFVGNRKIVRRLDPGPLEFLNLLYHAEFVLSTSFHGVVFSILFKKAFGVIKVRTDWRLSHLLSLFDLESRWVTSENLEEKLSDVNLISPVDCESKLNKERERGLYFLEKNLCEV